MLDVAFLRKTTVFFIVKVIFSAPFLSSIGNLSTAKESLFFKEVR